MEPGQIAFAAAAVAMALGLVALIGIVPWELIRLGEFACAAVAGYATFFHLADILEARNEAFALDPLGVGLIVAALAAVALAGASLLDRREELEGLTPAEP